MDSALSDGEKLIKDPIYGYIRLSKSAVEIINTDIFQDDSGHGQGLETLEQAFQTLEYFLVKQDTEGVFPCINAEAEKNINEHLRVWESEKGEKEILQMNLAQMYVQSLRRFCERNDAEFNFMLVTAKRFKSNFSRDIGDIYIYFPETKKAHRAIEVSTFLKADAKKTKSSLFYLFHTRRSYDGKNYKLIDPKQLANHLM